MHITNVWIFNAKIRIRHTLFQADYLYMNTCLGDIFKIKNKKTPNLEPTFNISSFRGPASGLKTIHPMSYYLQLFPSPCVLWVQLFCWWEGTSIFCRATTREQLWRQYLDSLKASADNQLWRHPVSHVDPAAYLQRDLHQLLSYRICCCPFHMEEECNM